MYYSTLADCVAVQLHMSRLPVQRSTVGHSISKFSDIQLQKGEPSLRLAGESG